MENKRRVVITGMGVVASNGIGTEAFWDAVRNNKSGIAKITAFSAPECPIQIAAEVKNFDPKEYLDERAILQNARFSQFAIAAAQEAIKEANLGPEDYMPERMGVSLGSSMGGMDFLFEQHKAFLKDGIFAIDTFITSKVVPSAATRALSLTYSARGPYATLSSSCVASTNALGFALEAIRKNQADVMIAGGAETPINHTIISGFYVGRILANNNGGPINVPRPFDAKRNGTVLGEGAVIFILEELQHALKRNATIYAEISGYAATNDAHHIVIPDPQGTQGIRAVRIALEDAGTRPEEVDYISAHGTATTRNDQVETLIIKKVFGERAYKIPVSATKPFTGHLLGGSGAIQSAISVLGIRDNFIAPTLNYQEKDPECDLDYVPNQGRHQPINVAVCNSFGFGGFNAVVVYKKFKP